MKNEQIIPFQNIKMELLMQNLVIIFDIVGRLLTILPYKYENKLNYFQKYRVIGYLMIIGAELYIGTFHLWILNMCWVLKDLSLSYDYRELKNEKS